MKFRPGPSGTPSLRSLFSVVLLALSSVVPSTSFAAPAIPLITNESTRLTGQADSSTNSAESADVNEGFAHRNSTNESIASAMNSPVANMMLPQLSMSFGSSQKPQDMVSILRVVMLMTVLTLAPAILIMMTSFTRIVVVLSFLRQALGTQQMPPNQLIVGLSLFLTFFVMAPTWKAITSTAVEPYLAEKISQPTAIEKAEAPLREFMFAQTREKDLELFLTLSKMPKPKNRTEVPTYVLVPSFVISELKTSFQIGFMLYLPFLVLDMVVASVLMAMGMMMLPPMVISLPFKLLLFVLVDGWGLIVGSLVKSFG